MRVIDCPQGSLEWLEARAGKPTASEFESVMARRQRGPQKGEPLKARMDYAYKLVGERLAGLDEPMRPTAAMQRGLDLEPIVRELYAERVGGEDVTQVGFVLHDSGLYGASPDSLVGDDGLVEIKTSAPHIYAEDLHRWGDDVPPRFYWQMVGQCLVADRSWCDLAQYCAPAGALRVVHLEPPADVLEALDDALVTFCSEVDELTAEVLTLMTDHGAPQLLDATA